jgi:hypothetical protein
MGDPVNTIFEAEAEEWESTFLSVRPDGRVMVAQGNYVALLSVADSIGLAALVNARSLEGAMRRLRRLLPSEPSPINSDASCRCAHSWGDHSVPRPHSCSECDCQRFERFVLGDQESHQA